MAVAIASIGAFIYLSVQALSAIGYLKAVSVTKGDRFKVLCAWVLMFFGMGLFFTREGMVASVGGLDASAKFQLVSVALAVVVMLSVTRENSFRFIALKPVMFLALYAIAATSTVVVSPAPLVTLYKAGLLFVDVVLICVTINVFRGRADSHYPLEICYSLTALFAAGALIGVVLVPEQALLPSKGTLGVMLMGVYPSMNPNELGFLGAVTMVVGLRRIFVSASIWMKVYWACMCYVGLAVTFLAQARTSLISSLLAIIFMSLMIRKMRFLFVVSILLLLIGLSTSDVADGDDRWQRGAVESTVQYLQRGQKDEGLQTLKGRADAWQAAGWQMFVDSPLIGHGYDAGVRYNRQYGMYGSHMHNSHVQIVANTGILGYLAWMGFVLAIAFMVIKSKSRQRLLPTTSRDSYFDEMCAVLILILLRTATGQVMVTHQWSLLIYMGVFIAAYTHAFRPYDQESRLERVANKCVRRPCRTSAAT